MPREAAHGAKSKPPLRTLAAKVNWLIGTAHLAGRGEYSNAEVVALIERVTGERLSHTTIWKLRNGRSKNEEEFEMLAMTRDARIPPSSFVRSWL